MSTKQARGTKRTCQSAECGSRFYDLNRNPIVCPICGTVYELAHSPIAAAAVEEKAVRKPRKAEVAPSKVVASEDAEVDGDDALADIETDDTDDVAAETDETFLEEEEEEGGDVSGIVPVSDGDEEP